MSREKIGVIATDLLQKIPETLSPIEQTRENLTEYEKNIWECVDTAKKKFDCNELYIVVITKKERLMENVLRNYFCARSSCPTPDFDQTVYKYYRSMDCLEFMWTVPARDICEYLRANKEYVHPEEIGLLRFVLDYYDETLLRLAKKLNGETMLPGNLLEVR